jgi:hypothetical protein
MTTRTLRRGRSFWASLPGADLVADPSINGAVIVIADPDFVPPPDAPHCRKILSAFLPAEVLREMLETLEGESL